MTTNNAPKTPSDDLREAIANHVHRYRPRLLTEDQAQTMLADIRAAVLRAEPTLPTIAGNWMSVVCRFIADTALPSGGSLVKVLTPAKLAGWLAQQKLAGVPTHTLRTRKGILDQVLRAQSGLPAKIAKTHPREIGAPPMSRDNLKLLGDACASTGIHAQRGFAAAFGSGRYDSSIVGATFEAEGSQVWLRTLDGLRLPVASATLGIESLLGETVQDGDWRQVRSVASSLGLHLDAKMILRTFRYLALEEPTSLMTILRRFSLTEDALESVISYLPQVDTLSLAVLRDDVLCTDCYLQPIAGANARTGRVGHARVGSTPDEPDRTSRQMAKRVSRAEAQRLAKHFREKAEQYPEIPDEVRKYIVEYTPKSVTAEDWDIIGPTFREVLLRCGFRTDGAIRVHTTVLTAYLSWRHQEGKSLAVKDAMTDAAIDQFYLRGSEALADRTRNDYRSRLKTQARRVNPGTSAPQIPTLGYYSVKPGYTTVEEAMMRRVSLGQPRPETRRRLCAVVGFGGGAGVDPLDMRYVQAKHVDVREEGIFVELTGPRQRTVVVRRAYEPLVQAAVEGLKPDDFVLKFGRDKANPVARIIEDAELFDDVPKIDMRRLRTTWITWLITQPIPLNVILAAAGLKSARTLVDMLETLEVSVNPAVLRDGGAS